MTTTNLSAARFSKLTEKLKLAGDKVEVDFFLPKPSRPAPLVVVAHALPAAAKTSKAGASASPALATSPPSPTSPRTPITGPKRPRHRRPDPASFHQPPEKLRSAQIETGRVAVVGHSAGGLATLLAAADNRHIVLWVGLDPVDSGDIGAKAAGDRNLHLARSPGRTLALQSAPEHLRPRTHLRGPLAHRQS